MYSSNRAAKIFIFTKLFTNFLFKTAYSFFFFFSLRMSDYNPQIKRFLLPYEETLLELLIRYGLYIGAVFQVVCLISILIYHSKFFDGVILKVK